MQCQLIVPILYLSVLTTYECNILNLEIELKIWHLNYEAGYDMFLYVFYSFYMFLYIYTLYDFILLHYMLIYVLYGLYFILLYTLYVLYFYYEKGYDIL